MPTRLIALWDLVLPLGLILSLMTQLRPEDAPVGPGELLLVLWLIPRLLVVLWNYRLAATPRAFFDLLIFWVIFAASLCFGFMVSIVQAQFVDWSLTLHDIISYSLLAVLGAALTIGSESPQRLRRLFRNTSLVGGAAVLVQVLQGQYAPIIGTLDLWYWDRFRGWCLNPNQFALFCLALGALSIAASENEPSRQFRILTIVSACITFAAGFLAQSNAYNGVAIIMVLGFVFAKILRATPIAALLRSTIFWAVVSGTAALLLTAIVLTPALRSNANGASPLFFMRDKENTDQEAALRIALWTQAIQLGVESWYLGRGPGPHLTIPTSLLIERREASDPLNLVHPKLGLAANFEAHNTALELFVQGGALATASFLSLCLMAFWRALRSQADGLAIGLIALVSFGSFHVIFRHPIVWFLIVGALSAPKMLARNRAPSEPRQTIRRNGLNSRTPHADENPGWSLQT
ncbi:MULTISPECIES: O-antigen ligase family protein [unclassified Beijerinckia]|uniref:O-antigen ligase family protein n=1 Tax=unclassified Beijerinckia TaxID=2638183 RepID=UPI00089BF270|nr:MULTISPECIES: O-antigen ligase family protein [unclassified Beijerinckia]MDH7796989.1 hypothetical protein [Beijerinckia sp. GAS462]SEC67685.1 O-antigen ligase [Beijerinckia sp. 28-YEA-48]